jgi:putative Mn2+ efflux pump MntP
MTPLLSLLIIALSVALDALSVSVAGGVKARHALIKDAVKVGLFFGGFQAAMPLIGWLIGAAVHDTIVAYSGWIAFILLSLIGLKMIKDSFGDEEERERKDILSTPTLLILAIATSIDALVVGVTLNLINLPLYLSIIVIGAVTFALSFLGFLFGKKLGSFFEGKVEIIGGIALIGIGIKLLVAG